MSENGPLSEETRPRVPKIALMIAGASVAILAVGAGGYWLGASQTLAPSEAKTESGRRVLYWYDPMYPDRHFDRPGKSPFMDMQLVPRYADERPEEAGVRIDPGVAQNFGVRLAKVESAPLGRAVMAAGVLAFNERNVAIVQARASGFVERAHRLAVGDVVRAGAPIVDIRVPEWTAAQAEYLALRGAGAEIGQAARRRLIMLGMPASLVARVEREGAPRPVVTVTAPVAGAVTELDIRDGMTIMQGAALATIKSISPVWLIVNVPQADADVARAGGRVSARISAYPGERFEGRIESVLPAADPATRTVEVRIALPNPDGRLRPGMTADVELMEPAARAVLLAPSEAVIRTGRRTVAIVALDSGRFMPVEVVLGRQSGNLVEIRSGLQEGQRVVASGQFLIDSEASLSGALERLEASSASQKGAAQQGAPQQGAASAHEARGRVTALAGGRITIAHGPVASLNWPAMTMQFQLARPDMGQGLSVGDQVAFRFRQGEAGYVVEEIRKSGGAP